MHETSLMENILATATSTLAPYNVKRVNEVSVIYGPLANIIPSALEFAYEALSENTVFEKARFIMHRVPIEAECLDCNKSYEAEKVPFKCPYCGSNRFNITGGTDVYLESIDFDDDDEI